MLFQSPLPSAAPWHFSLPVFVFNPLAGLSAPRLPGTHRVSDTWGPWQRWCCPVGWGFPVVLGGPRGAVVQHLCHGASAGRLRPLPQLLLRRQGCRPVSGVNGAWGV